MFLGEFKVFTAECSKTRKKKIVAELTEPRKEIALSPMRQEQNLPLPQYL